MQTKSPETCNVATVTGSVVRIYGSSDANGFRPYIETRHFNNRGQALQFASDYDDRQQGKVR